MRASTLEKRTRILNVATELFIEQGYKDTSLDQIIAICGGSKQTVYRYFNNKEGLFVEVLAYNTKSNIDAIFKLSEDKGTSLRETLQTFAIKYLKGLCSESMLGLFRIICADFNKNDAVYKNFWEKGPVRIHQDLFDFFTNNENCQTLNISNIPLACEQLLALIKLNYHNMALLGFALPNDKELAQHVTTAVDTFLALYSK